MHGNKEEHRPSTINFATRMVDYWNTSKTFRNYVVITIADNLTDKKKSAELRQILARKFIIRLHDKLFGSAAMKCWFVAADKWNFDLRRELVKEILTMKATKFLRNNSLWEQLLKSGVRLARKTS